MDWKFIKDNKLIQQFKAHPLYWIFAAIFGWVMSNFLTTPLITAIAIVLLGYIALVILLEVWIKSKISHWMSDIWCYCAIYSGLLIICILIALPFWNILVYVCDRDNPYKQPVRTATATVGILVSVEDNSNMQSAYSDRACATLFLLKNKTILIAMNSSNCGCFPPIGSKNEFIYKATNFHCEAESDKTVYSITGADTISMDFIGLPPESNIIGGDITLTFNASLTVKIPIPKQISNKYGWVKIPDIQKYLKEGK
jgi:hypothetical protein